MKATLERLHQSRKEEAREGGFTLIELLIVIVILGILAAIVVFAVSNLSSSSAKSACNNDLKTVQTALEAYNAQQGYYPTAGKGTLASTDTNGVGALVNKDTGTGNGPWMKSIPYNSGHYEIVASLGTGSTAEVLAGTNVPATAPTNANVGATALTGAAADCSGVS